MVKGGAYPETIFDSIRLCVKQGKTVEEAIAEVESILHILPSHLPEQLLLMIRQECG